MLNWLGQEIQTKYLFCDFFRQKIWWNFNEIIYNLCDATIPFVHQIETGGFTVPNAGHNGIAEWKCDFDRETRELLTTFVENYEIKLNEMK